MSIRETIETADPCNVCDLRSPGLRRTCESLGRCDTRDAWARVKQDVALIGEMFEKEEASATARLAAYLNGARAMNILTDLRAALEIWEAAEAAYYDYDRSDIVEIARRLDDKMRARSVLFSKLIRYAPALLDVAREGVCPICHMRMAEGVYRNEDDEYVACPAAYHAALAPLVKEDTDES